MVDGELVRSWAAAVACGCAAEEKRRLQRRWATRRAEPCASREEQAGMRH